MVKFLRNIIRGLLLVFVFAGCASSSRMLRLSPYSADSVSMPDYSYLSRKNINSAPKNREKSGNISQDKIINIWPFYLKNNYFHSVLWPIFDYDQYGMAIRPFFNKEGNEYSILFPLAGWNTEKKDGWVLNSWYHKDGWVFFPLACHNKYTEYYFPFCYTTWRDGSFGTFSVIPLFCYARPDHNDNRLLIFPIGFVYKKNDESYGLIGNTYWGKDAIGSFPIFHKGEDFSYYLLYWQSPYEDKWGIFPVFAKLGQESWYCLLAVKNEKYYGVFPIFSQYLDNSQGHFFPFYNYKNKENEKRLNILGVFDKKSEKSSDKSVEKLTVFPFYQQQHKEYNSPAKVKNHKYSFLLSFFGYEYEKTLNDIDDPELYFYGNEEELEMEAYKFLYLGKIASSKILTYRSNAPIKKHQTIYTIFNYANHLSKEIEHNNEEIIKSDQEMIQKFAKELDIKMSNPKTVDDCKELKQEIFEKYLTVLEEKTNYFLPFYYQSGTDTRSKLVSFPFFYYSQNELIKKSYLNLLGILYNGSSTGDDYQFNVLGILSRGYRQGNEREFRILEYLYREREKNGEKDYLFFPFCYYRSSKKGSQFSFLYRLINIEKSENGTKGHLFYIPFGD